MSLKFLILFFNGIICKYFVLSYCFLFVYYSVTLDYIICFLIRYDNYSDADNFVMKSHVEHMHSVK